MRPHLYSADSHTGEQPINISGGGFVIQSTKPSAELH